MTQTSKASPPAVQTTELAEIDISALNFHDTLELLGDWMTDPRPRRIATANVDFLRLAAGNPELLLALQTCDLVTADGQPLVWLSRLLRAPLPERVAGSDLAWPLLKEAASRGASVYFLGGGYGVAQVAAKAAIERIPDLRVAGTAAPFIDWRDEAQAAAVADDIRATGTSLLLVGLGCPKQELFLERHLERTGANLGIGVGATLDFLAGKSRRAPGWMQDNGLEWVHRLAQEPMRLASRYLADATFLTQLTTTALRERISSAYSN
ncbi:MAG: N-acetylglucosaminyldiphosphoundecaprenol N-acetyl-beta-D-mannosaminyltransferase [Planctomycetota bacterium]|jgi:N-acetylglucosaminyldiphosphoundecaprenol N-acetyl-beta-D-mannosaminyltransferase